MNVAEGSKAAISRVQPLRMSSGPLLVVVTVMCFEASDSRHSELRRRLGWSELGSVNKQQRENKSV